ncbi:MAG: DUF2779 domain-containing protein [Vicinamibacterales bacterium]
MLTQTYRLSKSRLNSFRQCAKRLWLEVHKPELKQESDDMRRMFGVGHQVGAIAREAYPDGILIGSDDNLERAIVETEVALYARRPVFEATMRHDDVLVRADLMLPEGDGWHMAEVKSTASAKPYHVGDVATQVWVARACGVQVDRATIRHIDRAFRLDVRRASLQRRQYEGLLMDTDVTTEVEDLLPQFPTTVNEARATLEGAEPGIGTGDHCTKPYACPFHAYCSAAEPARPHYPVTLLPGGAGRKVANELRREGHEDLVTVPADRITHPGFQRIHEATMTGVPYRDADGASAALDGWAWPRHFLDFETIGHTVPVWVGGHPFEQAPFQFSCHVVQRDGSRSHSMFLDLSGDDPSRACAEALLSHLGSILSTSGCIVSYSAFERGCIRTLAQRLPDLAPQLLLLESRIVDLLPVVREHYYHRDMLGSYSIKAVLPALVAELTYAALDGVKDGLMAQAAYLEAASPLTSDERRERIRQELTDYCTLDTLAMVKVAEALVARLPLPCSA